MVFKQKNIIYNKHEFFLNGIKLERVLKYKYLGNIIEASGKLNSSFTELSKKGVKVLFFKSLKLYSFPLIPSLLKYRYYLKSYECLNNWPIYKQISLKLLSVEGYLALTVSYLVLKELIWFQSTIESDIKFHNYLYSYLFCFYYQFNLSFIFICEACCDV